MLKARSAEANRVDALVAAGRSPEPPATPVMSKCVAEVNAIWKVPAASAGLSSKALTEEPEGFVLAAPGSVPLPNEPLPRPVAGSTRVTSNAVGALNCTKIGSGTAAVPAAILVMMPLLLVLLDCRRPPKSNGLRLMPFGDGYGMTSCWLVVGPKKNALHASIDARPRSAPASLLIVSVSVGVSPTWNLPAGPLPPVTAVITELTPASIAGSTSGCRWASATDSDFSSATGWFAAELAWHSIQALLSSCGPIIMPFAA